MDHIESHVINANENNELPHSIDRTWQNFPRVLHDLEANEGDIEQEDLQKLFDDAEKPAYDGYRRVRTRFSGDTALSQVSNLNTVRKKKKGIKLNKGTLLGLLLNIPEKTKDGINARKDMVSWGIREIIVTLCELEMYFPPSFFDAMVHLVSHIVGEIKALGPIHLHYMFPFERYMGVVKGYVRNRSRPEGSIVEGYASEEDSEGREHMKMLRAKNIGRTETWYTKRHNEQFATWLKDKVASNMGQPNVDKIVERLGEGPKLLVKTYQGYEINGYTFYTKMKDERLPCGPNHNRFMNDFNRMCEKHLDYWLEWKSIKDEAWDHVWSSIKLKSAKAKTSALQNKNPSRLGRTGLSDMEDTWRAEKEQNMLEDGTYHLLGRDPITQVFGKEHGGRTKGVATTVGVRKSLGWVKGDRERYEVVNIEEIEEKITKKVTTALGDKIPFHVITMALPGSDFEIDWSEMLIRANRALKRFEKVSLLKHTILEFIEWPRKSIKIHQTISPCHSISRSPTSSTMPCQTPIRRRPHDIPTPNAIRGLYEFGSPSVIILDNYDSVKRFTKCKKKTFSIVAPHEMYFKDWEEWIEYEAILDLHINAKVDISFIHWWAMQLHSVVKGLSENRCVFLNPHVIQSSECLRNGKQVMDHIIDTKRLNPGKELYLAPYLQGGDGGHWLLFVVCPNLRRGYIVDSSKKENNETSYYFPEMVERAFEIKFDWTMVKIWDDTRHLTPLEIDQTAYMILNEFYRAVVIPLDTTAPQ
ncbi:ulp1 protease family, C-terminal catalytic domain-containing protein [Tanacetum coccineum]